MEIRANEIRIYNPTREERDDRARKYFRALKKETARELKINKEDPHADAI